MEARAEFRQPRISKSLVAIVAVSITLGLGVMAGTVAKNLNGSSATTTHAVVQGKGGPAVQSVRHGGIQTVEENTLGSTSSQGPDAQERNKKLAAPSAGPFMPERGFREGN